MITEKQSTKSSMFYLISIGLMFLLTLLFVDSPFEFLNVTAYKIANCVNMFLFLLLFILLFRQIRRLENKIAKRITSGLLFILAIPYFFIGLWTIFLVTSNNPPLWQDLIIYTNENNEKVISQWRRTSGSIYDYRDRKMIFEMGEFRISFDYNVEKLKGIWKKYNTEKKLTTTVNFDNKKE